MRAYARRVAAEGRNTFPEWMAKAIPSNGAVFDVPMDEVKRVYSKMEIHPDLLAMRATG